MSNRTTPKISPDRRQLRATLAALAGHHGADHPAVIAARREHDVARVADAIREVVDQAPPLTPDQRDRLAVLLRPEGAARR